METTGCSNQHVLGSMSHYFKLQVNVFTTFEEKLKNYSKILVLGRTLHLEDILHPEFIISRCPRMLIVHNDTL